MEAVIRKWGNSPAVRLNVQAMKAAAFDLEQAVSIKASKGRIVIEPLRAAEPKLEDLLAAITPDNLHAGASFGAPRGREAL